MSRRRRRRKKNQRGGPFTADLFRRGSERKDEPFEGGAGERRRTVKRSSDGSCLSLCTSGLFGQTNKLKGCRLVQRGGSWVITDTSSQNINPFINVEWICLTHTPTFLTYFKLKLHRKTSNWHTPFFLFVFLLHHLNRAEKPRVHASKAETGHVNQMKGQVESKREGSGGRTRTSTFLLQGERLQHSVGEEERAESNWTTGWRDDHKRKHTENKQTTTEI